MKIRDKGNYIEDFFWNVDLDLSDKIVISNMSLGFFNEWGKGITDKEIAQMLSVCRWLYISTTPELMEFLEPNLKRFNTLTKVYFPRCFWGKNKEGFDPSGSCHTYQQGIFTILEIKYDPF